MGLDIGGYKECPDWPKMGSSLLIATLPNPRRSARRNGRPEKIST